MKSDRLHRPLAHNAKVFVMVLNEDYQSKSPIFWLESDPKINYSQEQIRQLFTMQKLMRKFNLWSFLRNENFSVDGNFFTCM